MTKAAQCASQLMPRILSVFALVLVVCTGARAVEFRNLNPIPTPGSADTVASRLVAELCADGDMCTNLVEVAEIQPLRRRAVQQAVREVARAWNSNRLEQYLGRDFVDRNRLLDTISDVVPRDARMRVLAVRNVQTLAQYRQPATPERSALRLSVVSARAETQVEYNDPVRGFVRSKKDVQEYVFVIADGSPSTP